MKIIDISPLISEKTAVFPGDLPFRRDVAMSFEGGQHLELSSLHGTVHLGAHADAPSHYHSKGVSIDQRPLDRYMGRCQVISVSVGRSERILPQHVRGKIDAPRVLFKTGTYPNPDQWNGDFAALSPELIHWLADQAVFLVGIDTPSVDPADSKALESHQALYARDFSVLEGIVLDDAKDGIYELIALPLRLKGFDASPVRAVLVKD